VATDILASFAIRASNRHAPHYIGLSVRTGATLAFGVQNCQAKALHECYKGHLFWPLKDPNRGSYGQDVPK